MKQTHDLNPAIITGQDGIYLKVHLQPGARTNMIRGMHGDAIKLSITVAPQDGKANRALIEFIAQLLGSPKSAIQLVSGQTSRRKRLFISGQTEKLIRQVESWL